MGARKRSGVIMKARDWGTFVSDVEALAADWDAKTAAQLPEQFAELVKSRLSENLGSDGAACLGLFDYADAFVIAANFLADKILALLEQADKGPLSRADIGALVLSIPPPSEVDRRRLLLPLGDASKRLRLRAAGQKAVAGAFSRLWLSWLQLPLAPPEVGAAVSALSPRLEELSEPRLLCDFFLKAFALGGPTAAAALKGLFSLIHRHELDYPQFYTAVYSLLTPELGEVEEPLELLEMVALFLTSTHIPAYTIAAFLKRLTRIALLTPTPITHFIVQMARNLLVRHKALKEMVERTTALSESSADPFLEEESDPAKTCALASSLWELKSLRSHWLGSVSSAAAFLPTLKTTQEEPLRRPDVADWLMDVSDISDAPVPTNHLPPPADLFTSDLQSVVWTAVS